MAEVSTPPWFLSNGVNDNRPIRGLHNPIESYLWHLGATGYATTLGDMTVLWQARPPKIRATGVSLLPVKGRPFLGGQSADLAAATSSRSAASGTTTAGTTATGTTASSAAATASATASSTPVFFYDVFGESNLSGVWNQDR